jgi:hypothetical protein
MEAFAALEQRVSTLEQGTPEPVPPDPETEGVQATRIAFLIENFGINTFSQTSPDYNLWGTWPAYYMPDSVCAALDFLTADSGFQLPIREYHYADKGSMQTQWLREIRQSYPETEATFCVSCNGSVSDAESVLAMARDPTLGIRWIEGINEPNMDFGWGTVPVEQTMDVQRVLCANCPEGVGLMGPSVVAGCPEADDWIKGYFGGYMTELNGLIDYGNGHYYPPYCPCPAGTSYSIDEYVGWLWDAYGQHAIMMTEFHSTLYAASSADPATTPRGPSIIAAIIAKLNGRLRDREGNERDPPPLPTLQASEAKDGFFLLLTLLTCTKHGTLGLWWYALYDYGSTYECGLFPERYAEHPRSPAYAIRNLCLVTGDKGERRTFETHKLGVAVEGLPDDADWDVYESSDGRFFVPIWRPGETMDSVAAAQVTVRFARAPRRVVHWDLLHGPEPLRMNEWEGPTELTVPLPPGVPFLVIEP